MAFLLQRTKQGLINILFAVTLLLAMSSLSFAQVSKEKLQKTKKQLEDEIKYTNSLLEQTQKTKQTSLNQLIILNKQIEKRESLIETMNKEIGQMEIELEVQGIQIQKLTSELNKMKEEYDFSNAQQGKFYVPVEDIQLPIYLDKDVVQYLNEKCLTTQGSLQLLVNDLLRKDIEIAKRVAS